MRVISLSHAFMFTKSMTLAVTDSALSQSPSPSPALALSYRALSQFKPSLVWLSSSSLQSLLDSERQVLLEKLLSPVLNCLQEERFRDALKILFESLRETERKQREREEQELVNERKEEEQDHHKQQQQESEKETDRDMRSPSHALRGLLHRCMSEIQLMRLTKQLSRADELLNAKKYVKALKAYNAMNIDSLTTFSSAAAAAQQQQQQKQQSARGQRKTHQTATAVNPLAAPIHAFDALAATLKHQFFHNKGVALLKVHQIALAIVSFKHAIAHMALVQSYRQRERDKETHNATRSLSSSEGLSSSSSACSSPQKERERERRREAMKSLQEERETHAFDAQFVGSECSAEFLAICHIHTENYTEALSVLHALDRLAAEERLRIWQERERERERVRVRLSAEGEDLSLSADERERVRRRGESDAQRVMRVLNGDELSSITTHSHSERASDDVSLCEQQCCVHPLSPSHAAQREIDECIESFGASPSPPPAPHSDAVLLRNAPIRSILIAFCYIKLGKLIEAEHLLHSLDSDNERDRESESDRERAGEGSTATEREIDTFGAFAHWRESKAALLAMIQRERERYLALSVACARDKEREGEREKERPRVAVTQPTHHTPHKKNTHHTQHAQPAQSTHNTQHTQHTQHTQASYTLQRFAEQGAPSHSHRETHNDKAPRTATQRVTPTHTQRHHTTASTAWESPTQRCVTISALHSERETDSDEDDLDAHIERLRSVRRTAGSTQREREREKESERETVRERERERERESEKERMKWQARESVCVCV